jgi:hypothetical protein
LLIRGSHGKPVWIGTGRMGAKGGELGLLAVACINKYCMAYTNELYIVATMRTCSTRHLPVGRV